MHEKLSTAATYGGSGVAVFFGFTPGEWQIIGIIGGLVIGAAGLLVNAYFQWQRFKRGGE